MATASSTPPIWAWGDGTSSQSTGDGSVAHQYNAPGRYTVVVTAVDTATGREQTFEFIHVVYDAGINIGNPDRWRSSTSLAYHPTRPQIWNVNPDHNSVTVIDRNTRAWLRFLWARARPHWRLTKRCAPSACA